MRAGNLDRRIDLQRKTTTLSDSGDPVVTWSTFATVWANYAPARGDEPFQQPKYAAKQQVQFRIRYSADVASLTPLDRIVYPSGSAEATDQYDIHAVHEVDRRDGLIIIATRRADA